jgi:toxin HigB-1
LKRYWERSETRRLLPASVDRIRLVLDRLDTAISPDDLDLPGLGFHSLSRKGEFAVVVTRNWRITFGWQEGDAVDVDLEDYH